MLVNGVGFQTETLPDSGPWDEIVIAARNLAAAIEAIPAALEGDLDPSSYGAEAGQPFSLPVDWEISVACGNGYRVVADGCTTVDIEGDLDALIAATFRRHAPDCVHDWREGGVNLHEGTSLTVEDQCRRCGMVWTSRLTGSQRNPCEADTWEVSEPDDSDVVGCANWALTEWRAAGWYNTPEARELCEAIHEKDCPADMGHADLREALADPVEDKATARRVLAVLRPEDDE